VGAAEVVVTIPYSPRPLQAAIHTELESHRFGVVVCHRRFGKTVMAINHLIRQALTCRRERPRYAYLAPTYTQGKAIAWDYLKHYSRPVPGTTFNESELRVDYPNVAQVRIYGADNPDALRGIYLDGVVADEFGLMQGKVWYEVLRPALSDRTGWALFIGTPAGKNAFWDLRDYAGRTQGWFVAEYRASTTDILPADELKLAREAMSADAYAQEFECSFEASVRGAIFAREMAAAREQGRIGHIACDPALPVHTAWDLGIGDTTAIWFLQLHWPEVRVIDFYEQSGEGLGHYVNVLNAKGYTWGKHILPHDVEVRELGTGRSRKEMLATLGLRVAVAPNLPLDDGIEAARMFLKRCHFDAERCKNGLDSLQNYRREENTRTGELKPQPVHDWASHAADAFRMAAVTLKESTMSKMKPLRYDDRGYV
jgi:phage terminase large subunit